MPNKASIKKVDVAWLAGIVDGEGSIICTIPYKRGYHLCRLTITNTDEGILSEARRILDEWLVVYRFKPIPASKLSKLPCFRIEVFRHSELIFIFEKIMPYLKSVRKQKAQFMLHILRQNTRLDGRRSNGMKKVRQYPLI